MSGEFVRYDSFICHMCAMTHIRLCDMKSRLPRGPCQVHSWDMTYSHVACVPWLTFVFVTWTPDYYMAMSVAITFVSVPWLTFVCVTWPIHVRAITYTHHYRTNQTLKHTHAHTHTRTLAHSHTHPLSSLTQIHTNAPLQDERASCWDNCRRITPDRSLSTRILATVRCSSPHKQSYIPAKEPYIPAKDPCTVFHQKRNLQACYNKRSSPHKQPCIPAKEPYIPAKENRIPTIEPCAVFHQKRHWQACFCRCVTLHKQPCTLLREPYILAKELYILTKETSIITFALIRTEPYIPANKSYIP